VAVLRPPLRLQLLQWITDSTKRIRESSPSIVRNSCQHGAYSYFPNEGQEETFEEQQREDLQDEQEAESKEDGHSDMVVEEEEQEVFISSSSLSSSGDEVTNNSFCPQQQAPRVVPPQQNAPWRDPGWDDTSDSNYKPSSGDSSS
jgi:hypothetical protein